MTQSAIILQGRLHALERDDDTYSASIYNGDGKPEWREVSEDCYRTLKVKFGDYLDHLESVGGYEYRAYNINAQIEADWGRDLAELIDYQMTVDAVARENA